MVEKEVEPEPTGEQKQEPYEESCCQHYTPGVILALERHDTPPVEGSVTTSGVGLAESAAIIYSPTARLAMRAYFVAPGDEFRYLEEISRRSYVIATSLNYTGTTSESSAQVTPTNFSADVEAIWSINGNEVGVAKSASGILQSFFLANIQAEQPLVAVVEVEFDHCQKVVETVRKAFDTERDKAGRSIPEILVLAVRPPEFNIRAVDLWTYSTLALALCEVTTRITAINFSVDLGNMCGAMDNLPSPLGTWIYSFPLFEKLLDELLLSRRRRGQDAPLVFAAAGNLRGIFNADGKLLSVEERQWRLAYPAILPDVISVTQSQEISDDTDELSTTEQVHLPAVSPLKPCFHEPLESHCGTSFACAALAGRWAFRDNYHALHQRNLGQFEKIALLLSWSEGIKVSPSKTRSEPWVPCVVQHLQPSLAQGEQSSPSILQGLLSEIGGSREFLLTGSGAFTAAWLSRRQTAIPLSLEQSKAVLDCLGDFDLLYVGDELDAGEYTKIRSMVFNWLKIHGQDPTQWQSRIQIHSLRSWTSGLHLLQCVTPDACLFLTKSGIINPWQDRKRTPRGGDLDFFPPHPDAWQLNPQFRTGSAGLALGILVWLNTNLLAARLEQLFPLLENPPIFNWNPSTKPIENPLLHSLLNLLTDSGKKLELTSSDKQILFGQRASRVGTDRFVARLERTQQLMEQSTTEGTSEFWAGAKHLCQCLINSYPDLP